MNRGDRRESIFGDDQNREGFLATLTEACEKTGWEIHAYCLMGNQERCQSMSVNDNVIFRIDSAA
jgi:hypothetical protein